MTFSAILDKTEVANGQQEEEAQNAFQRHSGSRRSIRIVDEEVPSEESRRRKCC
jgi:hypothetical protein